MKHISKKDERNLSNKIFVIEAVVITIVTIT